MSGFGARLADWMQSALYWLPAIVIALSVHEFSHAYVAHLCGDDTAKNLGRMTINPIKHIDPIGLIMLLLVHFGWAKPVPVNYRNFSRPKRDIFLVSIAGIAANFIMAFIAYGFWFGFAVNGAATGSAAMTMLAYFYVLNLNLLIFNLIPVFPLDGYRILKDLLPYRAGTSKFIFYLERYGNWILIALLVSSVISTILSYATSAITAGFTVFYSFIFGLFGGI